MQQESVRDVGYVWQALQRYGAEFDRIQVDPVRRQIIHQSLRPDSGAAKLAEKAIAVKSDPFAGELSV